MKPDSESPAALLERALRLAPALGLATQGGRIGLRQSRAENQAAQRVWQIPHVPSDWSPAEVRTVLGTGFDQVTLINWRRHDSEYTYRFMAPCLTVRRVVTATLVGATEAHMVRSKATPAASVREATNGTKSRSPSLHVPRGGAGCQNYGPFSDPYYKRAPNIKGTQKGTIILTTTHMLP